MNKTFNIYCDESCHLENDNHDIMVLGCIWCPSDKIKQTSKEILDLKEKHNLSKYFEIKWTKVSPGKINFYIELLDYFFNNENLHFRTLIVPNKKELQYEKFNHDHDTFYYKMYYDLLKIIFDPSAKYKIYIDIKDTLGGKKVRKLHTVLCNRIFDHYQDIIEKIQIIKSHESTILQLADLLIGIISYTNRNLSSSTAKNKLVEIMKNKSHYSLKQSTYYQESKVNIFNWKSSE